jgi:hypothetical protein
MFPLVIQKCLDCLGNQTSDQRCPTYGSGRRYVCRLPYRIRINQQQMNIQGGLLQGKALTWKKPRPNNDCMNFKKILYIRNSQMKTTNYKSGPLEILVFRLLANIASTEYVCLPQERKERLEFWTWKQQATKRNLPSCSWDEFPGIRRAMFGDDRIDHGKCR